MFAVIEAGCRSILENSSFGLALLDIYTATLVKDLHDISRATRAWFNGTSKFDPESIMGGYGFGDPLTLTGEFGSLPSGLHAVFNNSSDKPRFFAEADITFTGTRELRCSRCGQLSRNPVALDGYWPLQGKPTVGAAFEERCSISSKCGNCATRGLAQLRITSLPAAFVVETTKGGVLGADIGVPSNFQLEHEILILGIVYILVAIAYAVPNAHFFTDALRINAGTPGSQWYRFDDCGSSKCILIPRAPTTEVRNTSFNCFCCTRHLFSTLSTGPAGNAKSTSPSHRTSLRQKS